MYSIGFGVVYPHKHVALLQQIGQLGIVMADGFAGLLQQLFMTALLQIEVALGRDVATGNDIVDQAVVIVDDGSDARLDKRINT